MCLKMIYHGNMTFKEAIAASPHGRAELKTRGSSFSNQTECSALFCLSQGHLELDELKSDKWKPTMDISSYTPGSLMEHPKYKFIFARKYLKDIGVL